VSTYPVWGWGGPADEPTGARLDQTAQLVAGGLGFPVSRVRPRPLPDLGPDRVGPRLPARLAALASAEPADRARHAIGRSYRDLVRVLHGRLPAVPDVVVRPAAAHDIEEALEFCSRERCALVPFGGGTSVVGGLTPEPAGEFTGLVSLDLAKLATVREVDSVSRSALVEAGTTGPQLEQQLRRHELTARFYPQSFERSTVGGWAATRAAGHFATGPTHIDDLVEAVHALTPVGRWAGRPLPADGAGPAADRLLLGSEGALGVVTAVQLRVRPRPRHRHSATFAADGFATGCRAVRGLLQAGLSPATCRLLDPVESSTSGTLADGRCALVLGFESPAVPVDDLGRQATGLLLDLGLEQLDSGPRSGPADQWRAAFLRAPYLREELLLLGVLVETFETAVLWSGLDRLVTEVRATVEDALRRICGGGRVGCRLTHVYEDGAAPYFTVLAPARAGSEVAQWDTVKAAASDAILAAGGTITHHHAVGRDHVRWYTAQTPAPFRAALRAAKQAVDPTGICNPGVLGLG
jgi:alkyldihydroxyacetonephosphate synthase